MPKLTTFGVSSNLDELMSSIKKEEEEKQRILPNFHTISHEAVWDEFIKSINAMSVLSALQHVLFEVGGLNLNVFVASERVKDVFLDSNYATQLVGKFKEENISVNVTIDRDRFPKYDDGGKNQKVTLTDMDKYKLMVQKNPALEKLRINLDLQFE